MKDNKAENLGGSGIGGKPVLPAVDCSYTGIVNLVQNNRESGIALMQVIIEGTLKAEKEKERLEQELRAIESIIGHYKAGISHIAKHIKLNYPIGLLMNSDAVQITHEGTIKVLPLINGG